MVPRCLIILIVILFAITITGPVVSLAQSDADQYEYIDISNPFLRKIPLAIPLFKNVTGSGEEERLSTASADLLSSSLEFTGYFKTLDRGAFLFDPAKAMLLLVGVADAFVDFRSRWSKVGPDERRDDSPEN